jgi:hypothetical protein
MVTPYKKELFEESEILEEIRRTAALWASYLIEYTDGGYKRDPTSQKLRQIANEDFCWDTVLSWKLLQTTW